MRARVIKILLALIIQLNWLFPMETVKGLDINKFMGKWYVISSIPNFVEEDNQNCYDIYTLNHDGSVSIEYFAIKNDKEFYLKQEATIIDTINFSKWAVRFTKPWIPFYRAPYEVIVLDKVNYGYMVVGYPGNDYGWIMARNSFMAEDLYEQIIEELEINFNYKREQFQMVYHDSLKY